MATGYENIIDTVSPGTPTSPIFTAPEVTFGNSSNALIPMPDSRPYTSSANGMSTWDKIFGITEGVAKLAGAGANIIATTKGQAPAPMYFGTQGVSGFGYTGNTGGSAVAFPSIGNGLMGYVDSYVAQSQTLKNATSNLGASAVSKFVPWLIGGIVLIGLILILKPRN